MKTTADATIPVHQFMAKFEMWHLYTYLFKYIRQDKNRIFRSVYTTSLDQRSVYTQIIDYSRWITVYLSLWFSCLRFSRVYHARWRVRHLLPKWRLLPKCVIAHVSWRGLHLLPKWQPTFIKNRGYNFGWVIHLVLSIICGIYDKSYRVDGLNNFRLTLKLNHLFNTRFNKVTTYIAGI
jgi:hypothetical protein